MEAASDLPGDPFTTLKIAFTASLVSVPKVSIHCRHVPGNLERYIMYTVSIPLPLVLHHFQQPHHSLRSYSQTPPAHLLSCVASANMQLTYTILFLLSYLAAIRAATSTSPGSSRADYVNQAMNAMRVLNDKWFDLESGLWDGMWWQSANILTTLADLASINPSFNDTANFIFKNVFTAALAMNGGTWLNGYYDDEGW